MGRGGAGLIAELPAGPEVEALRTLIRREIGRVLDTRAPEAHAEADRLLGLLQELDDMLIRDVAIRWR